MIFKENCFIGLVALLCLICGLSRAAITNPDIAAVLNTLPPQLALASVVPPGVDNVT